MSSCVDRDLNVLAIKPSGVAYDLLKVEDIVICDLDGKVVDGIMRPSSDTKTHAVLYKNSQSIGGIAHTHQRLVLPGRKPCVKFRYLERHMPII